MGTGIYALTGQVAKQVGGVAWLPFIVAFGVALMTAFSYLELELVNTMLHLGVDKIAAIGRQHVLRTSG